MSSASPTVDASPLAAHRRERNPWSSLDRTVVDSPAHRSLARRAALQSYVLLHNTPAPSGLPLPASLPAPLLLLGSAANDTVVLRGNYNGIPSHIVSMLEGLARRAPSGVRYYNGTDPATATAAARGASAVIAVVRSEPESESKDRQNVTVRQSDAGLLRALCALPAVRTIVVLVNGGAVDVSEWMDVVRCANPVAAIVETWLGGEEAGSALAALLFGDDNFAALSPVTIYRQEFTAVADVADASLRAPVGRGYRFADPRHVLFPFGHGLSYTQWSAVSVGTFDPPVVSAAWLAAQPAGSSPIRLRIALTNTGGRSGSRPLLLFLRRADGATPDAAGGSVGGGLAWPRKWLVSFSKAHHVESGATALLNLSVGAEAVSRWVAPDSEWTSPGRLVAMPGKYVAELSDGGAGRASCFLTVTA